jgi:CPA1 family monovalent cation:H+ antiporter
MAELLSHHLHIGGFYFALSPIIATTVAALLMGNYGRSKTHPRAEEFVEKLWGQLAFWANSLIFVLIGVLFVSMPQLTREMIGVIVLAIFIVAIARAISIYPVVQTFNLFTKKENEVPQSWQHLLSWGSLRGVLAVTMVLLIPDDLTFSGWSLILSPKEFLLSITIGCIAATLFIKATTIQSFMRKLKLDELTAIEKVEASEARALIHHEVKARIKKYQERGYIDPQVAARLFSKHDREYLEACKDLENDEVKELALRVLRMYAIGIEKIHLKQLYHYNEVNERVFKRLTGKLQLQLESVEVGNLAPNMSIHSDGKDVFEHLATKIRNLVDPETEQRTIDNLYLYYRAQSILSRKVLKELKSIDTESANHIFTIEALTHVLELYTNFRNQSEKKMQEIAAAHPNWYQALSEELASYGILKVEERTLTELYERQLITPKLYIALGEELK